MKIQAIRLNPVGAGSKIFETHFFASMKLAELDQGAGEPVSATEMFISQ
jgi:hypothetical protein